MAVAPFGHPFPAERALWQKSINAGVTWTVNPPASQAQDVAGPTGSQRFRTFFTIPPHVGGTFAVTASGDIWDNTLNQNARIVYDGVDQGPVVPLAGPGTFNLPAVPGNHVLELWIGASSTAGGLTIPTVAFDYANVVEDYSEADAVRNGPRCCDDGLSDNLLIGADFEAGSGTGAASVLGGPLSDYAACGPNIFNAPCGGATYSLFDGNNAGQVTANHPNAVPIRRIGARSLAVNVSANVNQRIVYWTNVPLVNGRTYHVGCDAAIINGPYSVGVRVDGAPVVAALPSPPVGSVWTLTEATFVWGGTTGLHTVSFNSNSGVLAGNDHTFDNFFLRAEEPDAQDGCCPDEPFCYGVPATCTGAPAQQDRPPVPVVTSVLEQNTSGFGLTSSNHNPLLVGHDVRHLFDGDLNGFNFGLFVQTGNGAVSFLDTIIVRGDYSAHDRRLVGFGEADGWGNVVNDGDGLNGLSVDLYDVGNNIIGTVTVPNIFGGALHTAYLAAPTLAGQVAYFRLRLGARGFAGGAQGGANMREAVAIWSWESDLSWGCGARRVNALVEHVDPLSAQAVLQQVGSFDTYQATRGGQVVITPTNLIQTNGPHKITFSAAGPFQGQIITNNPGDFSTLTPSDSNPVVTITGNHNSQFRVNWTFPDLLTFAQPAYWRDGVAYDARTNAPLAPGFVAIDCTQDNANHRRTWRANQNI